MEVSLETAFNKALQFHRNKNYKQAVSIYEKILKVKSDHQPTLINLGNIFHLTGNLNSAKSCFEKIIALDDQNIEVLFNLSIVFFKLDDLINSLNCFYKLIQINPNLKNLRYNLINIMRSKKTLDLKKSNPYILKNLFLNLFRNNDVDHSAISNNALLFLYEENDLKKYINNKYKLSKILIQNLIKEELFQLILQKTVITKNYLEKILTDIRKEIFLNYDKHKFNEQNFLISLAEQCWLNEYLWFVDDEEKEKIIFLKHRVENSSIIDEKDIALLGCYISLNSSKKISDKLINYESKNLLFNDLIKLQIKEPKIETDLKININSIEKIKNTVSKSVRQQYEENPYPRWRYCNQLSSFDFNADLNFQIRPNKFNFKKNGDNLEILLAGCGTGKHLLSVRKYENTNVLAIDLSLSSLAYAKRKVSEFDYKNVNFLHSDILNLEKLNKKFDVIESVGTLHHMENPIKGLEVLVKILKSNGILRLGLYSEIARYDIVKLREIIGRNKFSDNIDDIRSFRKFIISENESSNLYKSIFNKDFYTTSSVRDFLFHTKEHRYTIPSIIEILKTLNLNFLGFVFPNDIIKKEYSKMFPDDKINTNLENWAQFELKYPNTFMSMYQFWVKKAK